MKQMSAKYVYPLVVLSMLICVLLQVAWLSQLFKEEKRRTIDDIENLISAASRNNIYVTLEAKFTGNAALNKFFLSSEWLGIWQGFEAAKDDRLYKSFDINAQPDSIVLDLRLLFLKDAPAHRLAPRYGMGYSLQQMNTMDSLSLVSLKHSVIKELSKLGIHSGYSFLVHSYGRDNAHSDPGLTSSGFISKRYTYNLMHLHNVQLVVDSVTQVVWFKMGYFLLSSVLMIGLTGIAFYFIFKLMISRRLYADARVAFISNMTHEIKTPIATVALALESISKYELTKDPAKLQRYLNMGRQELQRLTQMVEKVLSLSADDGKIILSPVFYDVQSGLSDVIRSMELPLLNAGAVCRLIVSPEPCFIEGDALHLTAVFYNLIENAIKYAVKPLELLITCKRNREWVTISFKDNGPGIPEIYKEKIFDRFFRVPQPENVHPVKGSGLGLNYVMSVIKSHGGTITVNSEYGAGSTFTIKLAASHEF
ncbi:sensor histidine kinase [Pedobacter lusitanus]|uniref:sensor histidine kinase n=1 Tax=Pedobacter lusitanus TaxID=1503925 RepID=UPI000696655F|nr:HAMP domain-containing sensor histidine kinase [Pedobacter lusitanus]